MAMLEDISCCFQYISRLSDGLVWYYMQCMAKSQATWFLFCEQLTVSIRCSHSLAKYFVRERLLTLSFLIRGE